MGVSHGFWGGDFEAKWPPEVADFRDHGVSLEFRGGDFGVDSQSRVDIACSTCRRLRLGDFEAASRSSGLLKIMV